jgi:putative ABC transport system ATP-binding protein
MSETILRTSGLVRRFPVGSGDEITVLNNINIEIPKGKLIIIKGRSGSGKTTLLNILSALDTASEGEVVLKTMSADGEEEENVYSRLSDNARDRLRRNHMGFVFQSVALVPIMTAYENVDFGLRTAGYKGSRRERIVESLASVGLEERMKHMPAQLSGGE